MPFSPSRPCKSPGCSALIASGQGTYCVSHRRIGQSVAKARDRFRGTAAERGYDSRWQVARLAFLGKYPLCAGVLFPTEYWTRAEAEEFHRHREQQREGGVLLFALSPALLAFRHEPWDIAQPATVVDHIIPHKGDPELMWSEWNWQAITKRAHDRKTGTEQPSNVRISN